MKGTLKIAAVYCTLLTGAYSSTISVASAEDLMMGFKPDE